MAFPQTPLEVLIELFISGAWTDITSDVYTRDGISISRGRADYGQRVDPSTCSLTLNNRSGKYSPRNPLSPYYGLIGRNTPVRVSVAAGTPALELPGGAGDYATTPDTGVLDITGSIDVRMELSMDDWETGQIVELAGKVAVTGNQRSWYFFINADGRLVFRWSTDGSAVLELSSTVPVPIPANGRIALRSTLNASNRQIIHYTAPSISGPWTQLGDAGSAGAATSIFSSTAPLEIGSLSDSALGAPLAGKVYAFQLRNGINGTIVASPDFTAQTIGVGSFTDAAGRLWTINGAAAISNRRTRFVGEVSAWPSRWDVSGNDVYAPIEAAGILRRLGQGAKALDSTLRRRIPSYSPLAYWPMEDGAEATQAASPIDGVAPLKLTRANWAENDTLASSLALPVLASSGSSLPMMDGKVPAPAAALTEWAVQWMYRLDTPNASERTFLRIRSTGTVAEWYIQFRSDHTYVIGKDSDGVEVFNQGISTGSYLYGQWVKVEFSATQNGANVDWHIGWVEVTGQALGFDASFAGTVGRPTAVASPPDGYSPLLDGMAIGHISVWAVEDTPAYDGAIGAWAGETGGARMVRLAEEEALPFALPGDPSAQEQVGAQRPETLVSLLEDAADVDGGILYEQREATGLIYRDRVSLYNQTPTLELDYTAPGHIAPPLEPVDDDQLTRNDITVTRDGGSSGRAVLEEGPLSTQAPPNGVGIYDESLTLNLYNDDQPDQHAAWRLHLGTVDEARYPVLNIELAAAPSLIDAVTQVDSGDRITIANPPSWLPPGPIDLLAQGYSETIRYPNSWGLQFNCTPAAPWNVAWAGSSGTAAANELFSWADTDGSELAEDLDTTETAVDVLATDGPVWTADPEDSPYDLRVGGEVMTVTAPGGLLNPNPFFDTAVSSWTGASCALAHSTAQVHPHPRALGSMLITPAGGVASVAADSDLTAAGSVTPGGSYVISGWFYSPAGWSDLRPSIHWYTSAGVFISTSGSAQPAVPAGQWTYLEETVTAPSTAGRCKMRARSGATPTSSDVFYVWGMRVTRLKASAAYDTFSRTASSSWGIADSGATWTETGGAASDRSVNGSAGVITLASAPSNLRLQQATTEAFGDCEVLVRISVDQIATGASMLPGVLLRYVDSTTWYRARVHFATGGQMLASVTRYTTQVGASPTLPYTYTAGAWFRLRVRITGQLIQMRVWPDGSAEPQIWHHEQEITTDTIATGAIGLTGSAFDTNTNVSPQLRYDDFDIVTPQRFTVIRSVNGIVKAHSAGADVRLADPAIVAL